jgi:gas vesicle protein
MSSHDDGNANRSQPGVGRLLLAMLGGAAVGAAAAYLTAPRSGVETRRRIQTAANDARGTAERVPLALRKATEAAREAFNETLRTGGVDIQAV